MMRTLEKQEKEREEKLKAFHEEIVKRSEKVGKIALLDNKRKMDKEEEIIKKYNVC